MANNERSVLTVVRTRKSDERGRVWPLLLAGAVVVAVLVTNLIDFGADHLRVRLLDANTDTSWSHRATAAALAAGAAVALLRAVRSNPRRAWWAATAGILVFLFVVEISPVHVQVDRLSYGKLVYAPLLVGLVVCVWRLANSSSHASLMLAGLAALFVSYTIHLFGMPVMHALGWGSESWGYQARAGLKEGAELAGWLLVVLTLWRLARPWPRASKRSWDISRALPTRDDAR